MVCLVPRTGRHLQRYNKDRRLVVGCIPYRYTTNDELEVLVISCRNGQGMMFPKGGWELDESLEEAVTRETLEEAGVLGILECQLGRWEYMSKNRGIHHEGYVFPLLVTNQLELWPEKSFRRREWMPVDEAREVCQQKWMKEALEKFAKRLASPPTNDAEDLLQSSLC